jgi:glycerol-3-phosphate dehydrogenase (NAD(P)+)
MDKLAVIGAGKWGQSLFRGFSQKIDSVITSRTKRDIEGFVSMEEALKREYLVIVISSQSIKNFLKQVDLTGKKILVASKGIDKDNLKFLNEIYEEYVDKDNICYLGGPSFAAEVKEYKPTALVIASKNRELSKTFADVFPDFIKTYIDDDVIGTEIAGAYKNVIAIASGICEGLKLGNNAKASLLARGLVEMERFGEHFGAKKETFFGLAGAGDLFLTANSTLSRNYRVGLCLSEGKSVDEILETLGEVAEGVWTTEAIMKIAKKYELYTPIANEVYQILEGKDPKESLKDLLS